MEVDGAGWSWVHGLVIPILINSFFYLFMGGAAVRRGELS